MNKKDFTCEIKKENINKYILCRLESNNVFKNKYKQVLNNSPKKKVKINKNLVKEWIKNYIKLGSFSLVKNYYNQIGKTFPFSHETFYSYIKRYMDYEKFKTWKKYNAYIIIDFEKKKLKSFNLKTAKYICKLILEILEINPSISEYDFLNLIEKNINKLPFDRLIYLLSNYETRKIIQKYLNLLRKLVSLKGRQILNWKLNRLKDEILKIKGELRPNSLKKKVFDIINKKPNISNQELFDKFNSENKGTIKAYANIRREKRFKKYYKYDINIVKEWKDDLNRVKDYYLLKKEYEKLGKKIPDFYTFKRNLEIYNQQTSLKKQITRLKTRYRENDKNLIDLSKCPECLNETFLSNCFIQCTHCGLIIEQVYQDTSFILSDSEVGQRTNKQYIALGERTDFIGGLGTFIDYEKSKYLKDKGGKLLPPNAQKLFRRLKKHYSMFLRIKNHETEYRIFNILTIICSRLNLNKDIRNTAAYYYKKIIKNEKKVKNNISLIAFCLFYAVREGKQKSPITIHEIIRAFQTLGHRVNQHLILRDGGIYKHHLRTESTAHKSENHIIRYVSNIINSKDIADRMIKKGISWSRIEYQNKLINGSFIILKNLTIWQRGGTNPSNLAAAVIYLVDRIMAKKYDYKKMLSQQIISEATNIAEYSIRDLYVNLLFPLFKKYI